jgi:hypothetical protein
MRNPSTHKLMINKYKWKKKHREREDREWEGGVKRTRVEIYFN